MTSTRTPTETMGALALALMLAPFQSIANGLLVRFMYHRLLAPTFPGLPQHVGVAQAIGLSFFVGYLTLDEASIAADSRPMIEREVAWILTRAVVFAGAVAIGWFM